MSERKVGAASLRRPKAASGRPTPYERDVILWSQEQARLLRAGRFSELDIEHLADEIDDVGKSEKRELASRMAVLLAHLLKWRVPTREPQPQLAGDDHRPAQADRARDQGDAEPQGRDARPGLAGRHVGSTRSPKHARKPVSRMEDLPEACPWSMEQAADAEFWPE